MLNENSPAKWRVFGASVCGASHTQAGTDNQDAIGWWPETGEGPPLVICVSDGHGSPKSFRSDIGARLAVSVANETLVAQLGEPAGVQCLEGSSLHELARALVSRWTEAVWDDLNKRPFTDAELARRLVQPSHRREDYGWLFLLDVLTRAGHTVGLEVGEPGLEQLPLVGADPGRMRHGAGKQGWLRI